MCLIVDALQEPRCRRPRVIDSMSSMDHVVINTSRMYMYAHASTILASCMYHVCPMIYTLVIRLQRHRSRREDDAVARTPRKAKSHFSPMLTKYKMMYIFQIYTRISVTILTGTRQPPSSTYGVDSALKAHGGFCR